jgi:hypothetical protein
MISAVVWSGASCGDGWGTAPLGASESAGWFEAEVCAAVRAQPPSSGRSRVGQSWIFRGPSRSSLRTAVTPAKRDTLVQVPFSRNIASSKAASSTRSDGGHFGNEQQSVWKLSAAGKGHQSVERRNHLTSAPSRRSACFPGLGHSSAVTRAFAMHGFIHWHAEFCRGTTVCLENIAAGHDR